MNEYYLLRQTVFKNIKLSTKIYAPANETHIKKFVEAMDGIVEVFLVEEETNKKINLTEKLGKTEFPDKQEIINKIEQKKCATKYWIIYKAKNGMTSEKIYMFCQEAIENCIPNPFFMFGEVAFVNYYGTQCVNVKNDAKLNHKGAEYEKFIGKKYEEAGYSVEYTGIDKEKQDGGIDLIATTEEKIVFVQCKNWIETDYYKINAKDLRAFIGDCYIYLLENDINGKQAAFHFIISDDNMLSVSAKYYISTNQILKVKTINFDIVDK